MKLGSKFVAVALLFIGLVLVNYLASSTPLRIDATADRIYTLSPGTKALLGKLEDPVQLDFYFSKNIESLPIAYKNYAVRVHEMLRQYVRISKGKIRLNVIDPRPDSPEDEKASAAGLSPQMLPTGERLFFGVVATQADQQKNIPALNPQREQFLEYDLSQLIYTVQQSEKKKLGLITGLPLRGSPSNPMMMMQRQPQQSEPQFIVSEWERTFELIDVKNNAVELPANLDALAIIHPQSLTPKLQFAIDQFILSGKPVFIAVDPSSEYFKGQGGQMAMLGGPQPNISSDLPVLFKAYGINYNPQTVVGDLDAAAEVSTGQGQAVRYPIWLALTKENFNSKALPTAQLSTLLFAESGSFTFKQNPAVTITPLVESSPDAGEIQSVAISMAAPEDVARQVTPSGKKTLAALIQGKLESAFPNGEPEDEKPDVSAQEKGKSAPPKAEPAKKSDHLLSSKGVSNLIVVADTDWLLDHFSVRRLNFLGTNAAEPINDNLSFGSNSLEFLSGSQDLVSIRGKGSSLRPFSVIKSMEIDANKKYQEKLVGIDAQLSGIEKKLSDLQGKKGAGNRLIASPEVTKAIEDFRKQEAVARAERRAIRKSLRENIEGLGNRLLVANLLVSPLLLVAYGFWFYRRRHQPATA